MKEIGGYMEFELKGTGKLYHEDLIALNTTRNAVKYILIGKKIEKLYIPYFICDSITDMLDSSRIAYSFYHISEKFAPLIDFNIADNEAILIVNYYGQLSQAIIMALKEQYHNIILDNTHAFFEKPYKRIDTVYNVRKYFGVPEGAYVSTDVLCSEELKRSITASKYEHIIGRAESNAATYFDKYRQSEEDINNTDIQLMSRFTENILRMIDYEAIEKKRVKNFKYLHQELEDLNDLQINNENATYMYPLKIENAVKIRRELIKQKIYIPILWPFTLENMQNSTQEYRLAEEILPLPIDQRYELKDMEYIVNVLRNKL